MTKKVMAQTDELFALIKDDQSTGQIFETRFNGGVATYRSWWLADAARRKKGKNALKIVRFTRDRVITTNEVLNNAEAQDD